MRAVIWTLWLTEDARATLRGRLETLHRTLSGSDGSSTGRITSASPVSTSTRLRQPVSPPSLEPPPREAPAIYSAAMPEPLVRAPHGYGQHVSGSCPLPLHSLNDTSPPFVGTEPITSSESPSEGNQDQPTWPAGHPFAQRGPSPSERWQQLWEYEFRRAVSVLNVSVSCMDDLHAPYAEMASMAETPSELTGLQSRLRKDVDEWRSSSSRTLTQEVEPCDYDAPLPKISQQSRSCGSSAASIALAATFAVTAIICGLIALGTCLTLCLKAPTLVAAVTLALTSVATWLCMRSWLLFVYSLVQLTAQEVLSRSHSTSRSQFWERGYSPGAFTLGAHYSRCRNDVEFSLLSALASPPYLLSMIPLAVKWTILLYFELGSSLLQVKINSSTELAYSTTGLYLCPDWADAVHGACCASSDVQHRVWRRWHRYACVPWDHLCMCISRIPIVRRLCTAVVTVVVTAICVGESALASNFALLCVSSQPLSGLLWWYLRRLRQLLITRIVWSWQCLRHTLSPLVSAPRCCCTCSETAARLMACSNCLCCVAIVFMALTPAFSAPEHATEMPCHVRLFNNDTQSAPPPFKGRALLNRLSTKRKSKRSRGKSVFAVALSLVMDSGCTWHVHPVERDLVNVRKCRDSVEGIDNKVHRCVSMGDLPICAQDGDGTWRQLLISDVRCVPTIQDTLISIDQLWDESRVDVVFRDVRSVVCPGEESPSRRFPFVREGGLSIWHVLGNAADPSRPFEQARHCQALNVHSTRSTSHVSSLSTDAAVEIFHHRLHAGVDRLRRLPRLTADAPDCLLHAHNVSCADSTQANAVHSHRPTDTYGHCLGAMGAT